MALLPLCFIQLDSFYCGVSLKILKLFLLFILVSCSSHEQKETTITFDRYKQYYQHINKAELAIVDANYDSSLKTYKEAFELIPDPFIRDLYNAAIVAIKLKDSTYAISRLKKLLESNLSVNYLHNIPQFFQLMEKCPEDFYYLSKRKLNTFYSDSLWKLSERDQQFRPNYDQYGDTIKAMDKEIINSLIALMETYGYPKETEIINKGMYAPQEIVFIHAAQNRNLVFTPYLDKALKEGRLHPFKYSLFIDHSDIKISGKYGSIAFYKRDSTIQKEFSPAMEDSINIRREKIGLETIEDYNKKALFMAFYNKDDFLLHSNPIHWFVEDLPPYPQKSSDETE